MKRKRKIVYEEKVYPASMVKKLGKIEIIAIGSYWLERPIDMLAEIFAWETETEFKAFYHQSLN